MSRPHRTRVRALGAPLAVHLAVATAAVATPVGAAPPGPVASGAATSPTDTATRGPVADVAVCDARWVDPARDRSIPVRIRLPGGTQPVPVILFSHGLGGSVEAGTAWGEAWAEAGFAVIHLQHPGSDAALWQGERGVRRRLEALREGMTAEQLVARVRDVSFVLDYLDGAGREGACELGRLDLERVGMSGHSFGARTTLALVGQAFERPRRGGAIGLDDARIDAAVAFSPAAPHGASQAVLDRLFSSIGVPVFSITGTEDSVPALTDATPEDRILPFAHMSPGGKYLLVFEGADHDDFGGNPRPGAGRDPAPPHLEDAVEAGTVAFWRATLLDDGEARAWLEGEGLRTLLREADRFEAR